MFRTPFDFQFEWDFVVKSIWTMRQSSNLHADTHMAFLIFDYWVLKRASKIPIYSCSVFFKSHLSLSRWDCCCCYFLTRRKKNAEEEKNLFMNLTSTIYVYCFVFFTFFNRLYLFSWVSECVCVFIICLDQQQLRGEHRLNWIQTQK